MAALTGRAGNHARVVVLCILREELEAARNTLGAHVKIDEDEPEWGPHTGQVLPFVVRLCQGRGNGDSQQSTSDVLEKWQPELVVVCGIAGAIGKMSYSEAGEVWNGPLVGDVLLGDYVHYADYNKTTDQSRSQRFSALDHPADDLVTKFEHDLLDRSDWTDYILQLHPDGSLVRPTVRRGEILATESVLSGPHHDEQKDILRRFDHALGVDMESRGVGRAIHVRRRGMYYSPRWLSIRGVSDRVWAADPDDPPPTHSPDAERERSRSFAAATAAAATRRVLEVILDRPRRVPPGLQGADRYEFPPLASVSDPTGRVAQ